MAVNHERLGLWVGVSFLVMQAIGIGYARFVPERFFCWAPWDECTQYRTEVIIKGRHLEDREVSSRYQYRMRGFEFRSIHNIFSIIRQYESRYGKHDDAQVTVFYRLNGAQERTWKWPEH